MRRIQCLKYLVLATMLMESDVDPFDAQVRIKHRTLSPTPCIAPGVFKAAWSRVARNCHHICAMLYRGATIKYAIPNACLQRKSLFGKCHVWYVLFIAHNRVWLMYLTCWYACCTLLRRFRWDSCFHQCAFVVLKCL